MNLRPIRKLRRDVDELKMKMLTIQQLITGLEHRINYLVYAGGLQGGAVQSGGDSKEVDVVLGGGDGGDIVTDPNLMDVPVDNDHPADGATEVFDKVEEGSGHLSNVLIYLPGTTNRVVLNARVLFAYEQSNLSWEAAQMELVYGDFNGRRRALPVCVLR